MDHNFLLVVRGKGGGFWLLFNSLIKSFSFAFLCKLFQNDGSQELCEENFECSFCLYFDLTPKGWKNVTAISALCFIDLILY